MSEIPAVIAWWLSLELIGWAAWPLTATLLGRTTSRGAAFCKHLGLLLSGYLLWLLVSLKLFENTRVTILLVVAVVAGLSLAVSRRERLRELWRAQRGELFASEAIFLIAFLAYLAFRAYDPAINHTEKPMDLGFLNAILRSRTFPPNDMWLSGYAISYYYFGYLIMALVTKHANVPSAIGYNLALGSLFALTLSGAYGLVRDLLGGLGRVRARVLGLLGALFVGVVGNLEGFLELLHANGLGSAGFWRWVNIPALSQAPVSHNWLPGLDWWWWRATRLIQDVNPFGKMPEVIVEFPAFSFILGDMHPHVMALPFTLLALAVAWNLLQSARDLPEGRPLDLRGRRLAWPALPALAPLVPLVVGALGFLNSWDLPTYGLIVIVAYAIGRAWRYRGLSAAWAGESLGFAGLVLVGGLALYLPFYIGFRSQVGGLGAVTYAKTPWLQYALIFGLFLAVLVPWLIGQAVGLVAQRRRVLRAYGLGLAVLLVLPFVFILAAGGLLGAVVAGFFSAIRLPLLALALALLLALALGLLLNRVFRPGQPLDEGATFALLLATVGLLLTYGTEFLFIRDSFGTRMNTMFKFYYQAWLLLAIAAAWGVGEIVRRLGSAQKPGARRAHGAWLGLVGLLLIAGLYYPIAAGASKAGLFRGQPTLDGSAWVEPGEKAAITWLGSQAVGAPVILEATGDSYQAAQNRVSALTGLPTVLGWYGHEGQWGRDGNELARRSSDIAAIYQGQDPGQIHQLLAKYGVQYVYVGPCERQKYGLSPASLRLFDQIMDRVYDRDGVVIYRTR